MITMINYFLITRPIIRDDTSGLSAYKIARQERIEKKKQKTVCTGVEENE